MQENILLTQNGIPKIGDFGHVISAKTPRSERIGTNLYAAPETLNERRNSPKIDVYRFRSCGYSHAFSAGIVVFEMFLSLSVKNVREQLELTYAFVKVGLHQQHLLHSLSENIWVSCEIL